MMSRHDSPRLLADIGGTTARFDRSRFRSRFEDKGRLGAHLAHLPCYIITAAYPAFTGASAILAQRLNGTI
jgi:glucokinase